MRHRKPQISNTTKQDDKYKNYSGNMSMARCQRSEFRGRRSEVRGVVGLTWRHPGKGAVCTEKFLNHTLNNIYKICMFQILSNVKNMKN